MDLTPERKKTIDEMSYRQLLYHWRFAPVGNPWFQGETGKYWGERLSQLRNEPEGEEQHVKTSKSSN